MRNLLTNPTSSYIEVRNREQRVRGHESMNIYVIELSNGLIFTELVTVDQLIAIVESAGNVVAVHEYNEDGSLTPIELK